MLHTCNTVYILIPQIIFKIKQETLIWAQQNSLKGEKSRLIRCETNTVLYESRAGLKIELNFLPSLSDVVLKGIILPSVNETLILGVRAKILQKQFTLLNGVLKRPFTYRADLVFLTLWGMGKHGTCLSSESWPYPQLCRVNMMISSIELWGWKASLCFLSSLYMST